MSKIPSKKLLVIVCGSPFSGKTTIARKLSQDLKIKYIDIDKIRELFFSNLHPFPEHSKKIFDQHNREMLVSYDLFFHYIINFFKLENKLIAGATFSSKISWLNIKKILDKVGDINLKIIKCEIKGENKKEIERRLKSRGLAKNIYEGKVDYFQHYLNVKGRFDDILFPYLCLYTSKTNLLANIEIVKNYLKNR